MFLFFRVRAVISEKIRCQTDDFRLKKNNSDLMADLTSKISFLVDPALQTSFMSILETE